MNKHLKNLIEKSKSENFEKANSALSDLGLLVERHTQNRYLEEDYLTLFGFNEEIFDLRLTDNEVEYLVSFFFYHILNKKEHAVTAAWCLGKCYNLDINDGMNNLLLVFANDDEVTLQLIYSINALFSLDDIKPLLLKLKERSDLPNTRKYLEELDDEGFFGSVLN